MKTSLKYLLTQLCTANKVESAPITFNTTVATGEGIVKKCGKVVTLTASVHVNKAGTWMTLGTIPQSFAPSYTGGRTWLSSDQYDGSKMEMNILNTGEIQVSTSQAGDDKVMGAWII